MKLWERVKKGLDSNFHDCVPTHSPASLTLITTYQCTAACAQCCFGSNPLEKAALSVAEIRKHIKQASKSLPSLKLAVFTGGECFLLGEGLSGVITTASECGLASRCVTNGYWAVSKDIAVERMTLLKKAGLTEINFSTGDEHQKFVPFERIVWGATSAAEAGIKSLIAVEGSTESSFSVQEVLNHPGIEDFMRSSPFRKNLSFLTNVWIPFHEGAKISQGEELYRTKALLSNFRGCSNILDTVVINPNGEMLSCCGLTCRNIPEMNLGSLSKTSLKDLYGSQMLDFMKIWLWLDGPEKIMSFASEKNSELVFPENLTHPCQFCEQIFSNKEIHNTLSECYKQKVADVLFRYQVSKNMRVYSDPSYAGTGVESRKIGYGA